MTRGVWTMIDTTFDISTKGWVKKLGSICMSLIMAGCTTTHFRLNYKKLNSEIPLDAGAIKGERKGYVTGEAGGYLWSTCVARAEMSLNELLDNAEAAGADSVGNVVWDATGTSEPGCKRKWLYLILWPISLTPMFMNTRVEGVAYKKAKTAEAEPPAGNLVSKLAKPESRHPH